MVATVAVRDALVDTLPPYRQRMITPRLARLSSQLGGPKHPTRGSKTTNSPFSRGFCAILGELVADVARVGGKRKSQVADAGRRRCGRCRKCRTWQVREVPDVAGAGGAGRAGAGGAGRRKWQVREVPEVPDGRYGPGRDNLGMCRRFPLFPMD